jgi:hypothetical protein
MTNEEIKIALDAMSKKLDSVQKQLNDIIRQNSVLYYTLKGEPEKAETMSVKKTTSPSGAKQRITFQKAEVDEGKVKALYAAGWVMKDIAEDCGVSITTVYRILHPEKAHETH